MAFLSSPVRFILRPTSSSLRVCTDGETDGRSYGDVISKFSRFDELPIFFTNGVSLERFARSSFAIKIQPHTIDLSTRLWGINPTSSVVINFPVPGTELYYFRLNFDISKSFYRGPSTASFSHNSVINCNWF